MGDRRFHKRISEDLHVFGDQLADGTWQIRVVDAVSRPIKNARARARAIKEAYFDERGLSKALWSELPIEVQDEIKRGRP